MLIFHQLFTEMVTFFVPRSLVRLCRVPDADLDKRFRISITVNTPLSFFRLSSSGFCFFLACTAFSIIYYLFRRMAASRLLRSASLLPAREESGKLSSSSRFDSAVLSELIV
jgi:hypothetical protein